MTSRRGLAFLLLLSLPGLSRDADHPRAEVPTEHSVRADSFSAKRLAALDSGLRVIEEALGSPPRDRQLPQATIPLCTGLTIVTAIGRPEGDYESIKTVVDAGDREIKLAYSAQVPTERGSLRNFQIKRTVLREDLGGATFYAHYFHTRGPVTIPGSTAIGASTAVLRALKRTGAAELGIVPGGSSAYPADRAAHTRASTTTRRPGSSSGWGPGRCRSRSP